MPSSESGERFGQADDPGLRGAVGRVVGRRAAGGVGRDVDDAAGAALEHGRQGGAADEVRPAQVDLDIAPPQLRVGLPEWAERAVGAGVVDDEVEGAQLALDSRDGALDSRPVGDVEFERERTPARCFDEPGRLGQVGPGSQRHVGPLRGQRTRQLLPDAATRARDERDAHARARRSCSSSRSAASRIAAKGRPERSAIPITSSVPSARLSVQSSAASCGDPPPTDR